MIFLYITIVCFLLQQVQSEASNKLLDSLKQQAAKIATDMPSGYEQLIVQIQTNGLDGYDACASDQFNSMISKYGFSSEIVNNFRMVTFSQSEEFQSFHVSITQDYADIIEFIGAGANLGGTIQIGFIQIYAEGRPTPGKSFNQQDFETIIQALRASAYLKAILFLSHPPTRITNYKEKEQYLLDQNAWAIKMTEWGYQQIEDGSPCYKMINETLTQDCHQYNHFEQDELDVCILEQMPKNSYWKPCFMCFCSQIFFAPYPYLPKANSYCFSSEYPGVSPSYDNGQQKLAAFNNVHFWNQTLEQY